ncbi:cytochrome b, partial [Sphingomonas sp.]|uniref:cytochrome b n=1 Tax=Sphingomonas sp. TaxID=28214 RepID=UPI003B3B7223
PALAREHRLGDRVGQRQRPFHPYYTAKDGFGVGVFLIVFTLFLFFMPNALGHPDNYIEANPLSTPAHIVPEWYFLPFYAILKAFTGDFLGVPAKLWGVVAMFGSILLLFFLPWIDRSPVRSANYRPTYKWFFWVLVVDVIALGWLGQAEPTATVVILSQLCAAYYFAHFLIILPIVSAMEKPLPLPNSISESVLHGEKAEAAPIGTQD